MDFVRDYPVELVAEEKFNFLLPNRNPPPFHSLSAVRSCPHTGSSSK